MRRCGQADGRGARKGEPQPDPTGAAVRRYGQPDGRGAWLGRRGPVSPATVQLRVTADAPLHHYPQERGKVRRCGQADGRGGTKR